MDSRPRPKQIITAAVLAAALFSVPAHAFRCGNKIVVKEMHEAQVRRACGAPTTMRQIGRTVGNFDIPIESRSGDGWYRRHYPGYDFVHEVVVTEYVYNFGPHKMMRRLIFQGGILVTIESLGYGYRE